MSFVPEHLLELLITFPHVVADRVTSESLVLCQVYTISASARCLCRIDWRAVRRSTVSMAFGISKPTQLVVVGIETARQVMNSLSLQLIAAGDRVVAGRRCGTHRFRDDALLVGGEERRLLPLRLVQERLYHSHPRRFISSLPRSLPSSVLTTCGSERPLLRSDF